MNGLSLFSGIGGLDLALKPWVRTVAYCEVDPNCRRVLAERMQHGRLDTAPIFEDVRDLNLEEVMRGGLKKLSEEQAVEAVRQYSEGSSLADVAHLYGVTRQSMHSLLKRRMVLRPRERKGKDNTFYRGGVRADREVHDITERAIEQGLLVRPDKCETCSQGGVFKDGRTAIQAHHDDYNYPLRVRWLCQVCHHEWHKYNQPITKRGGTEGAIDIIFGGFP